MAVNGINSGGLRIELPSDLIANVSLAIVDDGTGQKKSNTMYIADIYYGHFGIMITGNNNNLTNSISLMYAVEQPINENISLGISADVLTIVENLALQSLRMVDVYLVLQI